MKEKSVESDHALVLPALRFGITAAARILRMTLTLTGVDPFVLRQSDPPSE